ncbi:hypothetical protein [Flavobacterium sp.]|uniref:hypothetical protein n=1 Tax=Flavobacterium sp. TaxID=239 RepID=UPI003262D47F
MEFEELQKLYEFLFPELEPFIERIGLEDQIKYDNEFEQLRKKVTIKKRIFIEKNSFTKLIFQAYELGAKYLKIHLIQESQDLDLNIGVSFSIKDEIGDGTIKNDLDYFWIIRNDLFLKVNKADFQTYKIAFNKNKLTEIDNYTKKTNTQYIKYDIDDVLRYIIKNLLSNCFNITGIMMNLIIFKNYTYNPDMNDRVGISVHTIINEESNKKDITSIGHDFGTVYP